MSQTIVQDAFVTPVSVQSADAAADARRNASVALSNMRGVVIIIVLAFHSFLAYLGSQHPATVPFDSPPYAWRAFPVVDTHRWFGFDIFCAWQDVYLMGTMFFLSALFSWPSLKRKGTGRFLGDRFQRLGIPYLLALVVIAPIAEYPAYAVTAHSPTISGYVHAYLALPFQSDGPMWFLWQLLTLTVLASVLYRSVPGVIEWLGRWSTRASANPTRYLVVFSLACMLGYVPMALAFTPWRWTDHGPLGLQFSRPLLYIVLYISGLALGAQGLGRGMLSPDSEFTRRWARWLIVAGVTFVLWMGLTGLSMTQQGGGPLLLRLVVDASFAVACASGCLAMLAGFLRFARSRSPLLGSLSDNAYGMYLLHYPFVVWLQYALLGAALFAIAKAMIVLATSLILSWALAVTMASLPLTAWLTGSEPRPLPRPGMWAGTLAGMAVPRSKTHSRG